MRDEKDNYHCDAEIGKAPTWHVCNRKAVVSIVTDSFMTLHYCERHRDHADDRTGLYFKRRPFEEAQDIA